MSVPSLMMSALEDPKCLPLCRGRSGPLISAAMAEVDLVSHYRAIRGRIVDHVAPLTGAASSVMVPACPAWTVGDTVAHLTGLAVDLGAGRMPGSDSQAWIDGHVADRKGRPVEQLVDEWFAADVEGFIERSGSGQLVLDGLAHEHDICHALGRVGERATDAVDACVPVMSDLLRKDLLARGAPGSVGLTTRGRSWTVGEGPLQLTLEAEPFELLRVFGGRRSARQMRALPWKNADGSAADLGPWLAFLAHFPYPVADLVE
jgi:uncharacterized protein (TIGR03083 family)